ncbi:MAG TPA: serine/threonine-protein kinase [Polyangiaceae bacterium]|nr:serine/threonine-protein kinase [Polyangiaceae bacterium]
MSQKGRRRISMDPGTSGGRSITGSPSGTRRRAQTVFPGATLGGRFLVERLLASGAMGEVWQGMHRELRMRVALKTMRREMTVDHEIVARFSREAYLLSRVASEHVVRVLDFFEDRRVGPILVTEYVDGVPLAATLASRRFTVEEAIALAIDLGTGLRELHRAHIIHRDVKPSNVLMRHASDGSQRAVFIDLGVSRLIPELEQSDDEALTEITTAERAVGTFEYMAPEQIINCRNVAESADIYAVGAILYRAVCGQHVFGSAHGIELLQRKLAAPAPRLDTCRSDRVARGFEEVVARTLVSAPENRYELAEEMLADLSLLRDAARRVAGGSRTTSMFPPRPERTGAVAVVAAARRGSGSVRATAAACAVVALLVGVVAGAIGASRARSQSAQSFSAPSAAMAPPSPQRGSTCAPVCEPRSEDGP